MTSNLGSAYIREQMSDVADAAKIEEVRRNVMEMLKQTIKPEFLNRIDETIMFLPLNREEIAQVVRLQINSVCRMLASSDIRLRLTEKAVDYIADAGYDPEFGARPVKRAIQNLLLNVLSTKILGMEIDRSREIVVDADAEGLTFTN